MRKGLWGDVFGISAATALSRLLGLVREVVIANQFGASGLYDAYLIAFFIPHFLRKLVAEGALSTAFVPLYTRRLARGRGQADAFASTVFSLALVGFPLLIGLGVVLAPWLVPLLADGFTPEQQAIAVHLSRVTFPFLGLVGLASLVMAVLNGQQRFLLPALAPVMFNVAVILSVVFFKGWGIQALALGVVAGGAAQLAVQLPGLWGRFSFHWRWDWRDPALRVLGRMLLPALVGLAVVQVNVLVDNKLASRLPAGGVSALQYAIRLFQLPFGVFAVALSTAILPRLSARALRGEPALLPTLQRGLVACGLILFPATLGLVILGGPIIRWLFEHGEFSPAATARTLNALRFYALGLVPYGWVTVLIRAFYALQDGRTPVGLSALAVAVNVALALALVGPMGVGGLALSTALAGWAQWGVAMALLGRRLGAPLLKGIEAPLARAGWASGGMGLLVWLSLRGLAGWVHNEALLVLAPVLVGVGGYALLAWKPLRDLARP